MHNKYLDLFETDKLLYMFRLSFIDSVVEEAEFFFSGKNVTQKKIN
jgi:hypothetical protein